MDNSYSGDRESPGRSQSEASLRLWPDPDLPLLPLLERSCSDCGIRRSPAGAGGACRRQQGKFRRVLSETWNYPSWLFVESANYSSSDEVDLDPDQDAEIVVVDCSPVLRPHIQNQGDSDSEDEGWYSLSRTDVRKLQEVRSAGERCDVNIILTNPDILHLCGQEEEEERKQESSPERTSYSSLSSGDSGQLSSEGRPLPGSRKSSDTDSGLSQSEACAVRQLTNQSSDTDSGLSPGPGSGSQCSCSSQDHTSSSDISCDNEDSCAHKITVYVKYTETSEAAPIRAQFPGHVITLDQSEAVPLVEGCVDSEGEGEAPVITCDNDTITICDTRVRLRLCAPQIAASLRQSHRGRRGASSSPHIIPVKRKDLFKLLGLNESSDVLHPSEEADAKKVALQNFLCSSDKSDNTSKRNGGDGVLSAPKQGKKNLAKFLGIDMSALTSAEVEHTSSNTGVAGLGSPGGVAQGVALDAESVSISSSTTSGGRMPGARQILGLALPGLRSSGSRGASLEKSAVEEIPDQLRTPAVPQANRKDLQRFLGLNDSEEMVYIRNVRRPFRHDHRRPGGGSRTSQDCSSAGTISSVCSCVVCSEAGPDTAQDRLSEALVEHNCGNEKCIMCGPAPDTRTRMEAQSIKEQHEVALTNERTRLGPGERRARSASNTPEETRQRLGGKQSHSSVPPPPPPPPLPKKTVAPYQEYKFGLEEPMPRVAETGPAQPASAGREKRRKKQATKRMEQLIKIHTENVELSDGGGDGVTEPRCDHQQQLKLVRTLDRSEQRGRRLHKRSILKHHSKEPDTRGDTRGGGGGGIIPRPHNMKVKFAGSLRKREQGKQNRKKMMSSHPCQVHFPWHPDYLDMSHILAVVHPRYLQHHMQHK